MKFSIVVVSLNAGKKLLETVESILQQDYEDYEIIVKDGFSKDGSIERLSDNSHLKIYREKDVGIYDAMNQGIEKAVGDYLLFLNCGDYFYEKNVLTRTAEIMKNNPEARIYYGNLYNREIDSLVMSNPKINAFACYRNVPCHQTCFYQRTLLLMKGYNINYKVRADYEQFLWSFFHGNAAPVYLDITVASYEGGGYSETPENIKISELEHKKIVEMYMTKGQRFLFRSILLLTFVGLRKKMAQNPKSAVFYNQMKKKLYK